MKIKLNGSFQRLSDKFGESPSNLSKIFRKNIFLLEHFLKPFIFWHDPEKIRTCLPIPLGANFSKVQFIIDCMKIEIEIQKPDPIKQTLTWSEYKDCNTIKYLISCTLDGFINYVSKWYGGIITDVALLEKSNFLTVLPNISVLMANRGFKGIGKF